MRIIGIHDGHNASACFLENGKIKLAMQEERLTNIKNKSGFPKLSIEEILEREKIKPKDVDYVAIASIYPPQGGTIEETLNSYRNANNVRRKIREFLREFSFVYEYYVGRHQKRRVYKLKKLGFKEKQVKFIDHHLCHASTAYFGSPWRDNVLVLTNDGRGDKICTTVYIGNNNNLKKISETKEGYSIGDIYSVTTFMLGFVPLEHEYKLMGLAPYVKDEKRIDECYEIYRDYLDLDGLNFSRKIKEKTYLILPRLKRDLEYLRFDWISAGLQKFTEEMLIKWIKECVKETGLKRVACAGGTFMNVKANKRIMELPEVEEFFVFPSCGDESISIGSAYWLYNQLKSKTKSNPEITPLEDIYLGPSFSDSEVKKVLENTNYNYEFVENIEKKVAESVAEGEIVARCKGMMEFGARALGNRSILADPSNRDVVPIINDMIKNRDFWMPFAASILKERETDYIKNPKNVEAPYMILAFDTTDKWREMIAAIHPADLTIRPQIVRKEYNPEYYKILKEFENRTGRGVLLNTSFNLHGYPIVYGPKEALWTFKNSDLNYLALGNYFIYKGIKIDFALRNHLEISQITKKGSGDV